MKDRGGIMYEKMRIWIEVDTEAMIEKLKLAKKLCGGRRAMCVIKGDAHGHGAAECGCVRS